MNIFRVCLRDDTGNVLVAWSDPDPETEANRLMTGLVIDEALGVLRELDEPGLWLELDTDLGWLRLEPTT